METPHHSNAALWRQEAVQLGKDRADLLDLLQALLTEIEGMAPPRHGNAPYHSHIIAGVWDGSGELCHWCHLWARAKSRLNQLSAEEAHHEI